MEVSNDSQGDRLQLRRQGHDAHEQGVRGRQTRRSAVKVVGNRKVKVIVTQFAKGTKNDEPSVRMRKYIVRP